MTSPRNPFPINGASDFRAWKQQNSNAEKLLFRIIFRWRVSFARLRGQPGKWVANLIDFWAEDAKLSRDQTKRALRDLVVDGLVIRERGWFAGPKVHPFLRPTELALTYMGRPGDMDRLEASLVPVVPYKKANDAPTVALIDAPTVAPTPAPMAAPTITNPSIPSKPSNPTKPSNAQAHSHAHTKGKEGFGEKIKKKLILNPKPSVPEPKDVDTLVEVKKAKLKEAKAKKLLPKLLEKFPIVGGAHGKDVKHPYQMHGWKWATWSPELIVKSYDKYSEFIDNWYAGKKGKAYKPYSHDEVDLELDLDLDSIPDVEEVWAAKEAAMKAKKSKGK